MLLAVVSLPLGPLFLLRLPPADSPNPRMLLLPPLLLLLPPLLLLLPGVQSQKNNQGQPSYVGCVIRISKTGERACG